MVRGAETTGMHQLMGITARQSLPGNSRSESQIRAIPTKAGGYSLWRPVAGETEGSSETKDPADSPSSLPGKVRNH